eukprot:TRINITY_DN42714_c0_g1_i4.p1 TRINITY_DN42714_c0_g1~~TRINITY_DN42714_c0_g1_i4.p1  ORF type:complete len:184 (+),score=20.72 TRINITY_DN42714_c0_g1_i4:87-638(+)
MALGGLTGCGLAAAITFVWCLPEFTLRCAEWYYGGAEQAEAVRGANPDLRSCAAAARLRDRGSEATGAELLRAGGVLVLLSAIATTVFPEPLWPVALALHTAGVPMQGWEKAAAGIGNWIVLNGAACVCAGGAGSALSALFGDDGWPGLGEAGSSALCELELSYYVFRQSALRASAGLSAFFH